LFVDYLTDELLEPDAAALRGHLDECPQCANELAGLLRIRSMVDELQDPEPSHMTVNRILAHAREEAEKSRSVRSMTWVRILAPICLMAVVGGLAVYQIRSGILDPETTEVPVVSASKEPAARPLEPAAMEPSRAEAPSAMTAGDRAENDSVRPEKRDESKGLAAAMPAPKPAPAPAMSAMARDMAASGRIKAAVSGAAMEKARGGAMETDESAVKGEAEGPLDLLMKADRHLESGRLDQAALYFKQALDRMPAAHPQRPRALLGLARTFEARGELETARGYYETLADEAPSYRDMALEKIHALGGR